MIENVKLPDILQKALDSYVQSDERLLWVGQPTRSSGIKIGLILLVSGIFYTAFAALWILTAPSTVFKLFGIPIVLVGLMSIPTSLMIMNKYKNTVYAVTDKRAIRIFKIISIQARSFDLEKLGSVRQAKKWIGCTNLVFVEKGQVYTKNNNKNISFAFFGIAEADKVEEIIKSIGQEA